MARKQEDLTYLIDMLIPAMEGVRQRRKFIENEWLLNYRAWQGWPSQSYVLPLPDNAIHYFIPHARYAVEKSVKRGTKLLMPNTDWAQTLPFDNVSHERTEAVQDVMRYITQKKIPVKRNISSLFRCVELYNFAIQHTSVVIQGEEVWPYQRAVDPFNFYIFPDSAANLDEALLLFEDSIIPYQVYKSYVNSENPELSLYVSLNAKDLTKPEWPYHLVERLAYKGLVEPSAFVQGSTTYELRESDIQQRISETSASLSQQAKAFVSLSKVYFRVGSAWYYAVICCNLKSAKDTEHNAKIVRLDDTELTPMYRWTTTRPLPGELYTNSSMDDKRVLQNLTNNAISQVEAHRATFAEPPGLFDASVMGRMDSKTFGNRKVWLIDGEPSKAYMPFPVSDTSSEGIRAWQIYKGLIDAGAGGTIAEGEPGRNMPRSGSMTGQLLDMALIDVEDSASFIEEDILSPGLGDIHKSISEYVPESQLIKIPSKHPELVKTYNKSDINGDYSFTWLGALGFQGLRDRADKFSQFMASILNPQTLPFLMSQLAEQGMKFDIPSMIRTWYTYGLGERALGDIIVEMTDEDKQKYQQQQQQAQQQDPNEAQKMKIRAGIQGDMVKAKVAQQKGQVDMQKAQIDLAGKLLDFKGKQLDIAVRGLRGRENA